jgi:hypothetical protein
MKYFKIVNINNSIIQNGGGNFNIMSYNVCWEAMTLGLKLCTTDDPKKSICKSNILSNISNNIKKYIPDFATFQEASEHNNIIELFDSKLYNNHVNISGKEIMLTLWNKKKFTLINSYDSEFNVGRPYTILIFKNNKNNKNIALINIHANHETNTEQVIFDKINKFIKSNIELDVKNSITRVIMSGDFNRNVYEDNTSNYIVKFSLEFKLCRFPNDDVTYYSFYKYGDKYIYDHIIDSKGPILKKILGNSSQNYKVPSSDHILIIGKLKT